MASENWKKLLEKKQRKARTRKSKLDAATLEKHDEQAVIDKAIATIAGQELAISEQLSHASTSNTCLVQDEATHSATSDEEEEEEDLLDALQDSNKLPPLLQNSKFSKKNTNVRPQTSMEWFAHLNAVQGTKLTENEKVGKYVALDCEMVGVGSNGVDSMLARISLVNYNGHVLLDSYVAPVEPIIDYRTHVSGITATLLKGAPSFQQVMENVAKILKDRILVGHSLANDFSVMMISVPKNQIRDTAQFHKFRLNGSSPALRRLAQEHLGLEIQLKSHDSIQDARVAMLLYRLHRDEWEAHVKGVSGGIIKIAPSSKQKKCKQHFDRMKTANKRNRSDRITASDPKRSKN